MRKLVLLFLLVSLAMAPVSIAEDKNNNSSSRKIAETDNWDGVTEVCMSDLAQKCRQCISATS